MNFTVSKAVNILDAFAADKDDVDLLIVMGSSLKVSPVADVKGMHSILFMYR